MATQKKIEKDINYYKTNFGKFFFIVWEGF